MKIPKELQVSNDVYLNILSLLMIVFIVLDIKLPHPIATMIDHMLVKSVLLIVSGVLFLHYPVVGAIFLIFTFELFRRSMSYTSSSAYSLEEVDYGKETERHHRTHLEKEILRSGSVRDKYLMSFNQFPRTLEEDLVDHMVPLVNERETFSLEYKPVMDDIHHAAKL